MNIVVIGLGSMGKRRIRLLTKHFSHTIAGVDTREDRRSFCEETYQIATFPSLTEAISAFKPDCAFVCTSPLSHAELIKACLHAGLHVFTELNLVTDLYKENSTYAKEHNLTLFMSSTELYRRELSYITEQTGGKPACYSYHVGQYLPDWHPWENFQDFFIGNKRTNGCREIFAVELPWIVHTFGKITNIQTVCGNATSLNIQYPDYRMVLITHENGSHGSFIADVVCREPSKLLEVFNEEVYMTWRGEPNTLQVRNPKTGSMEIPILYEEVDQLDGYSSTILENEYLDEIQDFFDVLQGKPARYTFEDDYEILQWIDKMEEETC